ncbi:hypothetical protein C0580_02255 [Candidatus Parcubacteria bacterium]|nr:MAG: hypothetical protein C0580_02255 [Candidatus Parcubacteria bacterium]
MNISVAVIFFAFAASMFVASYLRGDLTMSQIHRRHYGQKHSGISHLGVWSDILILPWMCGIIWTYYDQWANYWPATLVALFANHLMHSLWLANGPADHNIRVSQTIVAESTVNHEYRLTKAGWIHYFYMLAVMILIIQFYFNTEHINPLHLGLVSVILGLHITLGTLVLNLIRQKKVDMIALLTTLVVWAILALRLA